MAAQQTGRRANALRGGREVLVRIRESCKAPPEVVYDLLTDLQSHLVWGGEQQRKNYRLASLDAPEDRPAVGMEFSTVGVDPMGRFTDVSVVTEATRAHVFEFVTEARLETRRGRAVDWTLVHRYELDPDGRGCGISYVGRTVRISELPGLLALFNVPVLSALVLKMFESYPRRGIRNLARLAEERADA